MSILVNGEVLERRDTTESWNYTNPVLPSGQLGWEYDASLNPIGVKMGDGVTHWADLPYWFRSSLPFILRTVTAGDSQPLTIAHTDMIWPSVLYRNSDGSRYGGATDTDTGTDIVVTGDADGGGGFADSFVVIVKA